MPALTLYATNTLVGVFQQLSETSPGADATSSPNVGWTVGTTAATVRSSFDAGVEKAWATQAGQPDGSLDTAAGDALRTADPLSGTFDTGTWTFHFAGIAVTNGGAQDGRAIWRLLRSANADGTGATQITAAEVLGSTLTNIATAAAQVSSGTSASISSFTLDNEYLFVQLAWEITGAGGMSNADVVMRIGSSSTRLVTPNFTSSLRQSLVVPHPLQVQRILLRR